MLSGEDKPAMPPDDSERPTADEIALLRLWIDQGAKGPKGGAPDPTILITPQIAPTVPVRQGINAVAVSPQGGMLAVARYGVVELRLLKGNKLLQKLSGHRGNVNGVSFSADGNYLVSAAGEAGLFGEARLWNVTNAKNSNAAKLEKLFVGHGDSLYAARLSDDSKLLATAGYDRTVRLWDVASQTELRTLSGHNDAVYDVAFHPGGKILASASGDRTVKLWDVATGKRLDTLGQSLKELYTLAFHPSGRWLAAGGVDNRIRVWKISKSAAEGTNPLAYARFAHEAAILRLVYSTDGRTLVSSGEDRLVKIWHAGEMQLRRTLEPQSDWAAGLALLPSGQMVLVGRLDGTTGQYALSGAGEESLALSEPLPDVPAAIGYGAQPAAGKLPKAAETEPNDSPPHAAALTVPGIATGVIHADNRRQSDVDLYRFAARAGEQWIIETNAARLKSPLDTKVEVLSADGLPIERLLLRAVRDSEVTFRGINSDTLDCRVVNWEEMELNQLLYIGGEVVKLYRMPRGPDSGFQFYPGFGKRQTYFDTTARSHALFEPCYIVVPYPAGSRFPDNGLPVFPVYFENDDEAGRKLGSDSRLTFTAPADGEYLVRVSDVRGFSGANYKYELTVRRPAPGFKVKVSGGNPKVGAGSGKSFTAEIERIDNFNGPVHIDVADLPPGFQTNAPLVVQAGHLRATGVISALADAPKPTAENQSHSKFTALAQVAGKKVTQAAGSLGKIELAEKPKLIVHLEPMNSPDNSAVDASRVSDSSRDHDRSRHDDHLQAAGRAKWF